MDTSLFSSFQYNYRSAIIMKLLMLGFFCFINSVSAVNLKLKVFPEPDDPKSNLIWYNHSTADIWSEKLDNYIEVYRAPIFNPEIKDNLIACDHDHPTTDDKACLVNTEKFNPCVVTNYFGYKRFTPCVFVELQKVDGWRPAYYNDTKSLPKSMPASLKNYIDQSTQEPSQWENIWISCDGDSAADKELIGPVDYYPQQGYPGYMFPYIGQKYYLNPTVAIQFKRVQAGLVINVVCKVWGPGIVHDVKKSIGTTTFQILVDHNNLVWK